ncbi:uncharacterized protein LOC121147362 isoform X2 [Ochotona curzoniae]|uniref:uncharacterized protein LOC121147362 isoform X2 n=1 Tax=Ochotona curzoniae TaxID=130825 RepID=UPI001B3475A0|nr:uncharacterized protein LOC121147362 isoform X2 [Ochotona curzoniae]
MSHVASQQPMKKVVGAVGGTCTWTLLLLGRGLGSGLCRALKLFLLYSPVLVQSGAIGFYLEMEPAEVKREGLTSARRRDQAFRCGENAGVVGGRTVPENGCLAQQIP